VRVRKIQRGAIQGHLVGLLKSGMSRGTVRLVHSVLRAMLNAALADGLITSNPADRLGRQLKLAQTPHSRQDEIGVKALDRSQVSRLLASAMGEDRTLLLTLARTGLRVSEAIGLEWPDVDTDKRQITVARATSRGRTDTPKSGYGRVVDMSNQLADALRRLLVERKAQTLKRGWGEVPRTVFCTRQGKPLTEDRIRATMARALKAAGLSEHLTPHCLRHTYASLMLQGGESPAYVQRMLGHASIKLTVDTYGKWLPMGNPAAANRLDDDAPAGAVGSKMATLVAVGGGNASQMLETVDRVGESNITGSWAASRSRSASVGSPRPRRRGRRRCKWAPYCR
jgi:integrase